MQVPPYIPDKEAGGEALRTGRWYALRSGEAGAGAATSWGVGVVRQAQVAMRRRIG